MGRKVEIEIPDPPEPPAAPDISLHPKFSELGERVARLEERTTSDDVDPTSAEALRLAAEAQSAALAAKADVEKLLARLDANAPDPGKVVEVPPAPPMPLADPTSLDPENREHQHPWWHPKSWL